MIDITRGVSNVKLYATAERQVVAIAVESSVKSKVLPLPIIPVKFVGISEFPRLYDVKVINSGPLVRQRTQGVEPMYTSTPYVIRAYNAEFFNDVTKYPSETDDIRFRGLNTFLRAVTMISKYGAMILARVDTEDSKVIDGVKIIKPSSFGDRSIDKIIEKVENINMRIRLRENVSLKYVETDVPNVPFEFQTNTPDGIYQESRSNFSCARLPLSELEYAFHVIGLRLFYSQYYHPTELIRDIKAKLPPQIIIDRATEAEVFNTSTTRTRVPRLTSVTINHASAYIFPNVVKSYRNIIHKMISFHVVIRDTNEVARNMQILVEQSITSTRAGGDIARYASIEYIPKFMMDTVSILVNPNLYIMIADVSIEYVTESLFKFIGLALWQLFIPPNVIPVEQRVRINNAFAYFIIRHKLPLATTQAMVDIPPATNVEAWRTVNIDYLSTMYSQYNFQLRQNAVGRDVASALELYFARAPPEATTVRFQFMDNRVTKMVQVSTTLPYLNGCRSYDYLQDPRYSMIRHNMYNINTGMVLPTIFENMEPSMEPFIQKIGFMRLILSRQTTKPSTYPQTQITEKILTYLEDFGTGAMRQYYKKVYASSLKLSLNPACDPIVRDNVNAMYKEAISAEFRSSFSTVVFLADKLDPENSYQPELNEGMPLALRAEMFRRAYREVTARSDAGVDINIGGRVSIPKTKRMEFATYVTGIALKDDGFSPTKEFISDTADQSELNRILEDNTAYANTLYIDTFFDSVKLMEDYMNMVRRSDGYVNRFYIVKNALCVKLNSGELPDYLMGITTIPQSRIDVKYRYSSTSELAKAINKPPKVVDGYLCQNDFMSAFERMDEFTFNSIISAPGGQVFPAIEVHSPARVKLHMVDMTSEMKMFKPQITLFSDVISKYASYREIDDEVPVLNINITALLNNVGEVIERPLPSEMMLKSTLKLLQGAQVIVPLDDILKVAGVEIMSVGDYIARNVVDIPFRKQPFEMLDSLKVDLVMSDVVSDE